MFDSLTNSYGWMADALGGPGNTNVVLMACVALCLGWIVLRVVRSGAAAGAAARMTQREGQDPTLLLALKQAEARIQQLEAELDNATQARAALDGYDGSLRRRQAA